MAAIILARGGSKGIPLKNISKFGNSTLLNKTLQTVSECNCFSSIWVSTDSTEILNSLIKYPSSKINIFWRSPSFATDSSPSILAVQEITQKFPFINKIALIQCTSPFIKPKYLKKSC